MDIQTIIATSLLVVVLAYLGKKYVINPIQKSGKKKESCGSDCSCGH